MSNVSNYNRGGFQQQGNGFQASGMGQYPQMGGMQSYGGYQGRGVMMGGMRGGGMGMRGGRGGMMGMPMGMGMGMGAMGMGMSMPQMGGMGMTGKNLTQPKNPISRVSSSKELRTGAALSTCLVVMHS